MLLLHPARRRRRIIALLPAAAILILAKTSDRQIRLREQVFEVVVELRGWAGAAGREEGAGGVDGFGDFFFEGLRGEGGVGISGGGGGGGEADLRAEAGGCVAHFDGGFGHAVEGFATGFCGGAFGGQVGEDGGRGADGVFDVFECLWLVSLVWRMLKVWG